MPRAADFFRSGASRTAYPSPRSLGEARTAPSERSGGQVRLESLIGRRVPARKKSAREPLVDFVRAAK
jgi:hypothetical protein